MVWLIGAALAGPPPEELDLEAVTVWEDRAFLLADGPKGCWVLRGEFETRLALYLPMTVFSRAETDTRVTRGTFSGTMRDGTWESFVYSVPVVAARAAGTYPLPEGEEIWLRPLVGALDDGLVTRAAGDIPPETAAATEADGGSVSVSFGGDSSSEDAVNAMRASIDDWWDATVRTSYLRWDRDTDSLGLVMEVPTSDARGAELVTLTATFPGAGPHATRIDTVLPKRQVVFEEGPIKVKAMNGQLHLRGRVVEGLLLPTTERWGGVIGAMGFTVGYEQRMAYTSAQECP